MQAQSVPVPKWLPRKPHGPGKEAKEGRGWLGLPIAKKAALGDGGSRQEPPGILTKLP